MIMTEEEKNEQLELCEREEKLNLYTDEEINIILRILEDDKSLVLKLDEIDNLLAIVRFLKLNDGIVSSNLKFSLDQLEEVNNYLEGLKSYQESPTVNALNLFDVSNYDVEETKVKDGVMTEEEKNTLIASYGRSDVDLFAIRLDYLNAISINSDNIDEKYFHHNFTHKSLVSLGEYFSKNVSELGHNYTLIKYLGDNKFKEYYTGKTIILYREAREDSLSFLKKLKEYRENPLCILIGLKDLKVATSEIENKIIANAKKKDRIEDFINRASVLALRDLEDDIVNMISDDQLYAEEENKIYEFKKVIK